MSAFRIPRGRCGHLAAAQQQAHSERDQDCEPLIDTVYLFATLNGQPYYNVAKGRADGFDAIWKRYMVKAKAAAKDGGWTLEHFTEHDIRATAGTDAEEAGQQGHKLLGNSEKQFRTAYSRGVEKVHPLRRPG
jgi:integrase